MKREIKFRAWTGNKMEYDIVVGRFGAFYVNPEAKGDGLDPKDTASPTLNTTRYFDDMPVMEFTGLLDKNGKEIFEGDILRTLHYRTESEVSYLFHKVVYDNERATFNAISLLNKDNLLTTNGNCFLYVALKDETCEVIGNIFENPELLKS